MIETRKRTDPPHNAAGARASSSDPGDQAGLD